MLTLLLLATLVSSQAPSTRAPVETTTYQMVLFKQGTARPPAAPEVQMAMQKEHLERMADLNRKRVNLLYGPVLAPGSPIAGIAVLDVKTADEAKQAFAEDPFVKAGVMAPEVHPWIGPKNWFRQPASYDVANPASLETLVVGFLMRGPNAPIDAATVDAIRKDHRAYLESLQAQGKVAVAGAFADNGAARGFVVYRVKDVAAAQALASQDPAVQKGLFVLEAYPWMTFKGILN
jgi:uncharacterized protein